MPKLCGRGDSYVFDAPMSITIRGKKKTFLLLVKDDSCFLTIESSNKNKRELCLNC